jgi:hypothetical protein
VNLERRSKPLELVTVTTAPHHSIPNSTDHSSPASRSQNHSPPHSQKLLLSVIPARRRLLDLHLKRIFSHTKNSQNSDTNNPIAVSSSPPYFLPHPIHRPPLTHAEANPLFSLRYSHFPPLLQRKDKPHFTPCVDFRFARTEDRCPYPNPRA